MTDDRDQLEAERLTQAYHARVKELAVNMTGAGEWADCHLCDRETTRRGRFDTFDAAEQPMCWRCITKARASGERRFWWR